MNPALYIARRYLFARKTHNVINVISAISVAGMAVGTAALILILSVYNGFDALIKDNLSDIDPDFRIVPQSGKYFTAPEGMTASLEEFGSVGPVLEDNVFFSYCGRQGIARAVGIGEDYLANSGISEHLVEGEAKLHFGDVPYAILGSGLAYSNGIRTRFIDPIEVYFPDRRSSVSLSNPTASLHSEKVFPGGIFSISADTDAELMLLPFATMQSLLGCTDEVTSLELRIPDGSHVKASEIEKVLPEGFKVLDRWHQHPSLFKMMRYEKAAVYLILIFVVIIIAFNIFGSLSMLIIEKKEDIATLKALGADDRTVRRIFVLEGWMISLLGLTTGLVIGIALALLQQHLGIIKLPGNYLVQSYPVVLKAADVLAASAGVALIGYIIARLSAGTVRS